MKKIFIMLTIALCVLGCKKNEWADWKTQNEVWLKENAKKEGVVTTSSGLQYKVIYPGNPTDTRPQSTSTVIVDYEGHLITGYIFDRNTAATMSMSSVVEGFAEGLKKIHSGGDIEIYVPWELGYIDKDGSMAQGTEGTSSYLPAYSTLIFTVHLVSSMN